MDGSVGLVCSMLRTVNSILYDLPAESVMRTLLVSQRESGLKCSDEMLKTRDPFLPSLGDLGDTICPIPLNVHLIRANDKLAPEAKEDEDQLEY